MWERKFLREPLRSSRHKNYMRVLVADCVSRLARALSLRKITAEASAQDLVLHCMFLYETTLKVLSKSGRQLSFTRSIAVCTFSRLENLYTSAYQPLGNACSGKLNWRTIFLFWVHEADRILPDLIPSRVSDFSDVKWALAKLYRA